MISFWEFLITESTATERASIDAHQTMATVSSSVLRELRRARRLRWLPPVWFSPWMRQYLATFIDKLEQELNRRGIKRQSHPLLSSRSRHRPRPEPSAAPAQDSPRECTDEPAAPPSAPGTEGGKVDTQFEKGLRRGKEVARNRPRDVAYWLLRARASRRRWTTRWLNHRKKRFLDGFIQGLESHLAS